MFFVCHFNINPCHSLFFGRDHLRSNIGITCGQGSFAVQFGDHLRSGIICGPGIICGLVQYSVVLKIFRFVPISCLHLPDILSNSTVKFLTTLLMNEARAFYSHFTREKIHLPRQNLSEFSLFFTTQKIET